MQMVPYFSQSVTVTATPQQLIVLIQANLGANGLGLAALGGAYQMSLQNGGSNPIYFGDSPNVAANNNGFTLPSPFGSKTYAPSENSNIPMSNIWVVAPAGNTQLNIEAY